MKAYLITDPAIYGNTPDSLTCRLETVLKRHRPDMLCYRDKEADAAHYEKMAGSFLALAAKERVKALLHGDYALASRLNAYGVHLTSSQFDDIPAAKAKGLYVIISTHTQEELERAAELGADAVTYSPVFYSPGKGNPKGLEDLKERVAKISITIFALGGIVTPAQVKEVESAGCYGFASIRYFIDN